MSGGLATSWLPFERRHARRLRGGALSNADVASSLVDNHSTDGSVDEVQERFGADARLSVHRNDRNLGFTACNQVPPRPGRRT
jgi:GT2 family glycosyltransferase